ncbi:hypothetical protein [Algibacter sp.]|uniref:hypothetical protein n=1 Tax=Algibacter sp. TaxID=1872428 RepID=UPI003C79295D
MNLKYIVLSCLCLSLIFSCGKKKAQPKEVEVIKTIKKPSLELIWQTDSLLTTCESVLFDKASQTIYVSNVNNGPWEKDNNGFISTINTKGEIIELKWLEGLNAPKGLGLYNGKLFVNDINYLIEIDVESRKISKVYTIENNPQLNDLTVSPDGVVYSSGSNSNKIHKLENGRLTVFASNPEGKRLNGLLWQKKGIYYADFAESVFGLVNHEDPTFKILSKAIDQADGIVRLENGDFITTGWSGQIFYIYAKDWTAVKLLDTREQKISAADIDFIPETQTLLVPTFFHNSVMAYKLNFK